MVRWKQADIPCNDAWLRLALSYLSVMVCGPGGYHFSDFLHIGVPMNLLIALVTIVAIPFIWPLQG